MVTVCPVITQPANGFADVNCVNPVIGQDCVIGCNSGFTLQPNTPRIQCTSNGWNPSVIPICQQFRCQELVSRDGRLILDRSMQIWYPRHSLSIQLSDWLFIKSKHINYLECNSNGQWSGQLPNCVSGES